MPAGERKRAAEGLDTVSGIEFNPNRARTGGRTTKKLAVAARNFFFVVGTKKAISSYEGANITDTVDVTMETSKVLVTFSCLVDSLFAYSKHHWQARIKEFAKIEAKSPVRYRSVYKPLI